MERRELLKMIALVTGGAVIGGEFFLAGCKNPEKGNGLTFTDDDIAFLDEVAETILPKTGSAGAKEAKVGLFMKVWVNDCYTREDQENFHAGMKKLDEACDKMHGTGFMKASPEQRTSLLVALDKERAEYQKNKQKEDPNHYFQYMKQLTIMGYFTSKEGRTTALRYEPVPGKYIGDLDYKKGDKLFAGLN
ncbi:MAG: gluconate 2-dehydrogenase subunit 3 family protein [Terrimonas sp.]|nr:gluconate 2-dehydrogenase subunit 3 family protein [Terrimonas sp.]